MFITTSVTASMIAVVVKVLAVAVVVPVVRAFLKRNKKIALPVREGRFLCRKIIGKSEIKKL
jgi:hypothetical protein